MFNLRRWGDKNALKEAKMGVAPDVALLRARLFFDGGYYQKALDVVRTKKESEYLSEAAHLEYCYRSGRILQMMKHPNEATSFFSKTIELGHGSKFYYACNASLQLGLMYEEYGNKEKAKEFYRYCLTLKPDDYRDELHSKAKAGLSRLGGK